MFTIGDFATFTQVSVKALRHWERVGVLAPARVDQQTGYRYYRADQVVTVHRIAALQMLGFTLAQIRPMLDAPPAGDDLAALLEERRTAAERERERIDQLLAAIGARLHLLEGAPTMSSYDILDKTAPAVRLAAVAERVTPDLDDPGALHLTFGRLFADLAGRLAEREIRPVGPAWSLYDRSNDRGLTVHAALPVDADASASDDGLLIVERPALRVAATVHEGPLDDLASAYAAIMGWLDARGLHAAGGAAEISLVWDPERPERNVTELQLPIASADGR
jgi:DNA-binding transcriptional MerR regulator/effector-binding domain-containing protein